MKVRTDDLLRYANFQLETLENNKKVHTAKYEAAKIVYESKFLNKLFCWKYKDSAGGDTSWLNGSWYFFDNSEYFKELVNKCEYHMNIGDKLIEIPVRSESAFYSWASPNGL